MTCLLCRRVAKALHPSYGYRVPKSYDDMGTRNVTLGSWRELQGNETCTTCSLIVELFNIRLLDNAIYSRSGEYEFYLLDFEGNLLSLKLRTLSHDSHPFLLILPMSSAYTDDVGVVMDPNWIGIGRISEWIKSCDTTHSKCHCRNLNTGPQLLAQDTYLISLVDKCLIKADGGEKYIALSYVWGTEHMQIKASKTNLQFLRQKGSLQKLYDLLPGTVQRAMQFASLLGIDFLWVDFICIVQDDPVHTATQIENMASIYSYSYLTLCAADGADANSGLRGIPQCSLPRDLKQDILTFRDEELTSSWNVGKNAASLYDTRGWTFQEQVLSRRVLSFTDVGAEWRCQEIIYQEQNRRARESRGTYSHFHIERADLLWPCLKKWDNLVRAYLERNLTFQDDILRAFSGILSALDGSMLGGFHFGLPEQFFDAALLWVPQDYLIPRTDTEVSTPGVTFPSWSWAGWKGRRQNQINAFGLGHERSTLLLDHKPRVIDIFPCVKWFKVDMKSGEKAQISNNYAIFQSDGLEGTVILPPGWSSIRSDNDEDAFHYRYDKAPSAQTFWYPIPTVRSEQPASPRQWGPILNFRTLRSHLIIGNALSSEEQNGNTYPLHSLHTENGSWAGILFVHHPILERSEQRTRCELILLSGGFAFEDGGDDVSWLLPEWNYARRPRSGDYYLFYHVLWIEWRGSIAYRKGLGRVVQRIWDALPKEEVEVFLG